jgi:hypothetical protein
MTAPNRARQWIYLRQVHAYSNGNCNVLPVCAMVRESGLMG